MAIQFIKKQFTKQKRWLGYSKVLLLAGLFFFNPGIAGNSPLGDAIPPSNADLDALMEAAKKAKAISAFCELECPKVITCSDAQDLLQTMRDGKELLTHLKEWTKKASDDHLAHFTSLVNQESITAENMANTQEAIAVHQFLHDFGSTMLDIASVVDFAKGMAKGAASGDLGDMDPGELLNQLDSAYEALKDLESGMDTISGSLSGGEGTGTPLGDATTATLGADINDAKSYLSDAKNLLQEGITEGKIDWTSIGASVGRFAKGISASELEGRKKRLQDLMSNMSAEAKARANAYLEYQKANERKNKAIDAYDTLVSAMDRISPCITKLCGSASATSEMLWYLEQQLKNALANETEHNSSWGQALRVLNPHIANITERLGRLPTVQNICPGDEEPTVTEESIIIDSDSSKWCTYGGQTQTRPLISTTTRTPGTSQPGEEPPDVSGPGGGGSGSPTGPGDNAQPHSGTKPGDDDEDPRDVPADETPSGDGPKIIVKAKTSVLQGDGGKPVSGQLVKLDFSKIPPLPGTGERNDKGFADSPVQGITGKDGSVTLNAPPGTPIKDGQTIEISGGDSDSTVVELKKPYKKGQLGKLDHYVVQAFKNYVVLMYPASQSSEVSKGLKSLGSMIKSTEPNYCRDKQAEKFNDPYFKGNKAWGQKHDNQWALKQVMGYPKQDPLKALGKKPAKVIVAVIDSGIDWNHADISWDNLWHNPKEVANNGKDDDNNGYVDDVIGWDFWEQNNQPWDKDGHGTFVSGIIAASSDNKTGIAGMNPYAQIMSLKALNGFGHSRASYVAEAIYYAADNGAQVINLSVGGKNLTQVEQVAIDYAHDKGLVIVVASGNEGLDTSEFGPAGADKVITVAASDLQNKRTVFSNWGKAVSLAAPGVDVLSLRARRTDLMTGIPGVEYQQGEAYVGDDNRYYRASGTSFAAPFVAGAASLLLSKDPGLDNESVKRILLQSATDIDTAGVDQYSGYGLVNVANALQANPQFFIDAAISGIQVVQQDGQVFVQVSGLANADNYQTAKLFIGAGKNPENWREVVTQIPAPVLNGVLGNINANYLRDSSQWMIRLEVIHTNGQTRENWFELNLN